LGDESKTWKLATPKYSVTIAFEDKNETKQFNLGVIVVCPTSLPSIFFFP